MRRTLSELNTVCSEVPVTVLVRDGSHEYKKTDKQKGKGKGSTQWWESGLAWWLKALVAMVVIGVVLLDIFLLETVLDHARALEPRGAATGPRLPGAPPRGAAAAALAAAAAGGAQLASWRELARSALAIVPRGASSAERQAASIGDDGPARPSLGLSTSSGHHPKRRGGGGGVGGGGAGSATLQLVGGLLPSREEQQRERERGARQAQRLRGRKGLPGGGRPEEERGGTAPSPLPPAFRIPAPGRLLRLRPPHGNATAAAAAGGWPTSAASLIQGPLPFVGLRGYRQAGEAQPKAAEESKLPPDFDWEAYLDYNPDVRRFGADTAELAAAHYLTYGYREGRVYRRVPLIVRYTACGGLFNQHYSHIAALSLALALGGDVLLPAAVKRDSFANYFSQDPKKNQVSWTPEPFDTLWDADTVHTWLRGEGMDVAEAPDGAPLPDLRLPGSAFQHYAVAGVAPKQIVELRDVYLAAHDFRDLLADVVAGLAHQAQAVARPVDEYRREFPPLLLDIPCSLFTIATRELPLAAEVALGLRFSRDLEALADAVVAGILATGAPAFNGLHLRIERDAADWTRIMGGHEAFWGLYLEAAAAAGLGGHTSGRTSGQTSDQTSDRGLTGRLPLYMASGILSYQDADNQLEDVQRRLAPFCAKVVYKEQFLPAKALAALHPDQLAVVDFLVLVRSRAFVGLSASTFSVFIREYRHLARIAPRNTSRLVDCTPVGSEPLFARAAVLPPPPGASEESRGAAAAGLAAGAAAPAAAAAAEPAAARAAAAGAPAWAAAQLREVAAAAAAGARAAAAAGAGAAGAGATAAGAAGDELREAR